MSIGNGAIHIHLLIASTSGAWTPSSMRSNAPWTLQLGVHSLFHLYSFLLIHFLHAVEVGEARWLPLLPPSSPPPHIVSCILYLIARSLYIFLTSHRNGSCVVQTSSSAWGAGYRGRGRGRAWSGSESGHGYGYLWRSSVPVRTRSQVGTRIWILTMAAASDWPTRLVPWTEFFFFFIISFCCFCFGNLSSLEFNAGKSMNSLLSFGSSQGFIHSSLLSLSLSSRFS